MIKAKNQYELSVVVGGITYAVFDIFKTVEEAERCAEELRNGPNPLNPVCMCIAVVVDYGDSSNVMFPYGVFVGDGVLIKKDVL